MEKIKQKAAVMRLSVLLHSSNKIFELLFSDDSINQTKHHCFIFFIQPVDKFCTSSDDFRQAVGYTF
jgi:hypothetical protein